MAAVEVDGLVLVGRDACVVATADRAVGLERVVLATALLQRPLVPSGGLLSGERVEDQAALVHSPANRCVVDARGITLGLADLGHLDAQHVKRGPQLVHEVLGIGGRAALRIGDRGQWHSHTALE
jgi:hypothetical protein